MHWTVVHKATLLHIQFKPIWNTFESEHRNLSLKHTKIYKSFRTFRNVDPGEIMQIMQHYLLCNALKRPKIIKTYLQR